MNIKVKNSGKGFGKSNKSNKFYVVFRPDTEEFFVKYQETILGSATVWQKYPDYAKSWKDFDQARSVAMQISMMKQIEIHVCSVIDSGPQYRVETESRFAPNLSNLL